MKIDVITIFPGMFESVLNSSILKRARQKGLIEIEFHNPRDFTVDKHRTVDEPPYGGGGGMVMKIEPLVKCLKKVVGLRKKAGIILLTPAGKRFNQKKAIELSKKKRLILICGHYEGIDERISYYIDEEISAGDYVLTGGELPAMAVIDAIARLLPGVLGNSDSVKHESFMGGVLDFPHYTRPEKFEGRRVPKVLLSGDHKKIAEWRRKESLKHTEQRRPDLINSDK